MKITRIKFVAVIILALLTLNVAYGQKSRRKSNRKTAVSSMSTQSLKSYVGKYPYQLFKAMPTLKTKMKVLLGKNYQLFMDNLTVQGEIGYDDGFLVFNGCAPHWCGTYESIMVIDTSSKKLHCAILAEKFGKTFKIFSEDKEFLPRPFTDEIVLREAEIP